MYAHSNWICYADTLSKILKMSFYVTAGRVENKRPFGKHGRATLFKGYPNYRDIISAEASGDYIARVSNSQEEQGKLLVMGKHLRIALDQKEMY
jgi:hypothetical protein